MASADLVVEFCSMPLRQAPLSARWLRIDAPLDLRQERLDTRLVTVGRSGFGAHFERPSPRRVHYSTNHFAPASPLPLRIQTTALASVASRNAASRARKASVNGITTTSTTLSLE